MKPNTKETNYRNSASTTQLFRRVPACSTICQDRFSRLRRPRSPSASWTYLAGGSLETLRHRLPTRLSHCAFVKHVLVLIGGGSFCRGLASRWLLLACRLVPSCYFTLLWLELLLNNATSAIRRAVLLFTWLEHTEYVLKNSVGSWPRWPKYAKNAVVAV